MGMYYAWEITDGPCKYWPASQKEEKEGKEPNLSVKGSEKSD